MPLLLHIETATTVCSVALSENGNLLSMKESREGRTHAESITLFIEDVFKSSGKTFQELDAVCVSKGPGSYTGLRIGVSTAKGFCFSLGKPLISVNTLQSMAFGMREELRMKNEEFRIEKTLFCPMIDARRMEVYCAVFDEENNFVKETAAEIINENSFSELLKLNKIIFSGDGAAKCRSLLSHHPNAVFEDDFYPSSKWMVSLAEQKFSEKLFEDIAYFEPYYLKDFLTTSPRKLI